MMKKRMLGILLALAMVVSMMSAMTVTSFAAESVPQVTVEQNLANSSATDIKAIIQKVVDQFGADLKNYKPLIGVKNVKISKDFTKHVKELSAVIMAGVKDTDQLKDVIGALNKDVQIKAKDVVEFATDVTKGTDGKYYGTFSPVRVVKYNKAKDTIIYVRSYTKDNKTSDIPNLPKKLVSLTQLLPSGIQLTYVGADADGHSIYSFKMPNRMVTGYDFYGHNSTLSFLK